MLTFGMGLTKKLPYTVKYCGPIERRNDLTSTLGWREFVTMNFKIRKF